jgi:5'-3' exoribonuclease 1
VHGNHTLHHIRYLLLFVGKKSNILDLDRIISHIVKPRVSVYMAIDGVAPRAKLNQQRSRRFRSARDMAEATKDLPRDEKGKKSATFDSNCITPGTEFLAKVSAVIQYFIRKKIKEDPLWHNLSIIFSGHDVPGEGEHKIMQHIREMRNSPLYQPNTRHCIYGQDADLIMLGLVTHEPHFTILREVIDFSFDFRSQNTLKMVKKFTKEPDFQLLHLSVLREYLQYEFVHRQAREYDLERCIDDFVFLTFLVGNDFLPHMPTLDIGDGAFDLLFNLYREQRDTWPMGQYLTDAGEISDPIRLEVFLAAIGALESEILAAREKENDAYIKKRRKWDKRDGKPDGPSDAELKENKVLKQIAYSSMIENLVEKHSDHEGSFVDGWNGFSESGQKDYKGMYYFEKMNLTPVDLKGHWHLRRSYMEGLMWCLAYYYKGCKSDDYG